MSKLQKYKLNELYEMSSGISSTKEQAGHGSPFISFSTVFNNIYLPYRVNDLMQTTSKERMTYSVKKDDILITRTSETIDELAMSCVVLEDYPDATYSGFTKRLRPINDTCEKVYSKYIAFYLRGNLFRKSVTNNAFMTLRASFNDAIFSYLELHLPKFEEQKKIGDLLFSIEEKIQNNKKIIAELEAMAQTLYKYWFVQFDFPDAQGKPYKSSGGKMVYNTQLKREIPDGWGVKTLNEISTIVGGSTPATSNSEYFANDGICWITPKDLSNTNGVKLIFKGAISLSEKGVKAASLTILPKGSILMSSRAPVGYLAIAINDTTTNQGLKSFIPNKGWGSNYIYETINHIMPIIKSKATGSTFKEISASTLKTIAWHVADIKTANIFEEIIFPINKQLENRLTENQNLIKMRNWLLPMLMNGQLGVMGSAL